MGFVWPALWLSVYRLPTEHKWITSAERSHILAGQTRPETDAAKTTWKQLLKMREVQGIVIARFFGDPVWWLYLIWLPLYLHNARGFSLKSIGLSAWIPYVAADAGALLGGWTSGYLVRRGWTARRARGAAIVFATLLAPVGMLVGRVSSPVSAMALISVVLFAFQFW